MEALIKALKAAGYEKVAKLETESEKATGLVNLACSPNVLVGKPANFAALPVLEKAGAHYRDLRQMGDVIIIRDIRIEKAQPAKK